MAIMGSVAPRGHRTHADVPRRERKVYLSTDERAVIESASAYEGLKPGAFIAAAAVRTARAIVGSRRGVLAADDDAAAPVPLTISEARELLDEVRHLRRLMGNVAGNLNDVARHANSTGELPEQSGAVLDFVRRTNARVDVELMSVLRRLR